MDPTLGTDLSVDNRTTLVFLCAFLVLIRLSMTAADGVTLDTDRFLIRGMYLHGNRKVKESLGRRTGIHADNLIEIENRSVSSRNF